MEYANVTQENFFEKPLWFHKRGLMQTATGYGSKLSTPYMVRHNNRNKRVYCSCFSNCGTLYIMSMGKKLIIRY